MSEQRPADGDWRRLDRRMLLVHPFKELIRFLPAVIGLLIAGSASDGVPWWVSLIGVVGAIALGVFRWCTTRYRFTAEQVQLRSGFFSRSTTTAPTDRVRSVDVTASPLHRVLGLAEVKIGTGADGTELALDGLTAAHAAALREDLIHRRTSSAPGPDQAGQDPTSEPSSLGESPEQEIVRLELRWIRFALLTGTGLVSAAAIFGVGWQVLERSGLLGQEDAVAQRAQDAYERLGLITLVVGATAAAIVAVLLLSLLGYLLMFWGFRLTRHVRGGTLHVSRGLFTTRATTIEERRLRGVRLVEPLQMRPARGATLHAITTGLEQSDGSQSAMLLPPAPRSVARRVAEDVLAVPGVLNRPLASHGAAATRRRWTRALVGGVVLLGVAVGATFWWQPWLGLVGLLPLVVAPLLAIDRARSLGHALTERYVIGRSGSVLRSTEVVERSGVIGVQLHQSFFQRRAGLTTLTIAIAAGSESSEIYDVPESRAVELAAELLPGRVEAFRA